MTKFTEYDSRDALFHGLAHIVGQQLDTALNAKKHATLAVPGGTTPAPFFERLRQNPLDWKNIRVTLTDERFVPETSDRSNTRLLRQTLFQDHAKHAQFIPLYAPADQPEDVLSTLRMGVTQVLPLDVCVLGMGTDMHTASLFPGADLLAEALADTAPTVLPMRAPNAPEPRMTLSAPVLRGAGHVHLLITGKEKKDALQNAMDHTDETLAPVRCILAQAHVHYAE